MFNFGQAVRCWLAICIVTGTAAPYSLQGIFQSLGIFCRKDTPLLPDLPCTAMCKSMLVICGSKLLAGLAAVRRSNNLAPQANVLSPLPFNLCLGPKLAPLVSLRRRSREVQGHAGSALSHIAPDQPSRLWLCWRKVDECSV